MTSMSYVLQGFKDFSLVLAPSAGRPKESWTPRCGAVLVSGPLGRVTSAASPVQRPATARPSLVPLRQLPLCPGSVGSRTCAGGPPGWGRSSVVDGLATLWMEMVWQLFLSPQGDWFARAPACSRKGGTRFGKDKAAYGQRDSSRHHHRACLPWVDVDNFG